MGTTLVDANASIICPHGGRVAVSPSQTRVKAGGQPLLVMSDMGQVAGCGFTVPPKGPQPCVTARFFVPALRVKLGGQQALLQTTTGLCQSGEQIPQGPPQVTSTQTRVSGQ